MPRTLTSAATTEIAKKEGTEPINIIEVEWVSGTITKYADRDILDGSGNLAIPGKILSLNNIDEVVNLRGSSKSISVSVSIDDTDSTIKTLMDTYDLHKKKCSIKQFFEGLTLGTDEFLLISGEVSSPITWDESTRIISFEILSEIKSRQVGFAPEEAQFSSVPQKLAGKVWPLCFGDCLHVPAAKSAQVTTGSTLSFFGIGDATLTAKKEVLDERKELLEKTYKYLDGLRSDVKKIVRDPIIIQNDLIDLIKEEDYNKQRVADINKILKTDYKILDDLMKKADFFKGTPKWNPIVKRIKAQQELIDTTYTELETTTNDLADLLSTKSDYQVDISNAKLELTITNQIRQNMRTTLDQYYKLLRTIEDLDAAIISQGALLTYTLIVQNGENFPQNTQIHISVNGLILKGSFSGNVFTIIAALPAHSNINISSPTSAKINTFNIVENIDIKNQYALLSDRRIIKISSQTGKQCSFQLKKKQDANRQKENEIPVDVKTNTSKVEKLLTGDETEEQKEEILNQVPWDISSSAWNRLSSENLSQFISITESLYAKVDGTWRFAIRGYVSKTLNITLSAEDIEDEINLIIEAHEESLETDDDAENFEIQLAEKGGTVKDYVTVTGGPLRDGKDPMGGKPFVVNWNKDFKYYYKPILIVQSNIEPNDLYATHLKRWPKLELVHPVIYSSIGRQGIEVELYMEDGYKPPDGWDNAADPETFGAKFHFTYNGERTENLEHNSKVGDAHAAISKLKSIGFNEFISYHSTGSAGPPVKMKDNKSIFDDGGTHIIRFNIPASSLGIVNYSDSKSKSASFRLRVKNSAAHEYTMDQQKSMLTDSFGLKRHKNKISDTKQEIQKQLGLLNLRATTADEKNAIKKIYNKNLALFAQLVNKGNASASDAEEAFRLISDKEFEDLLTLEQINYIEWVREQFPIEPDIEDEAEQYYVTQKDLEPGARILETSPIILPNWIAGITSDLIKDQEEFHDLVRQWPTNKAFLAQVGSEVRLKGYYQEKWISNILPSTIKSVFAYRSIDGLKQFIPVPTSYYTKYESENHGIFTTTGIELVKPLVEYSDELWESQIYITMSETGVGNNTADIIQWLVENFTNLTVDATSFASVKTSVTNYPSNVVLLKKKDALKLIEELAWQARCAVWVRNNIFYLKYIPKKSSSVVTFNESNIEKDSLNLTFTPTEDLVTKFIAGWKVSHETKDSLETILRRNVSKYEEQEEKFDFFAYNIEELVIKSATFWMIRKANSWKKVSFRTFLTNLNLLAFDTVTLDFSNDWITSQVGGVDSIVEKVDYDSDGKSISVTCWVPIVAGSMTEDVFAFPESIATTATFPPDDDILSGNAGNPIGALVPTNISFSPTSTATINIRPADYGDNTPTDSSDTIPPIPTAALKEFDYKDFAVDNQAEEEEENVVESKPHDEFEFNMIENIRGEDARAAAMAATDDPLHHDAIGYGRVLEKIETIKNKDESEDEENIHNYDDNTETEATEQFYKVRANGTIYKVMQIYIDPGATIPPGSIAWIAKNSEGEYVMQVPCYLLDYSESDDVNDE